MKTTNRRAFSLVLTLAIALTIALSMPLPANAAEIDGTAIVNSITIEMPNSNGFRMTLKNVGSIIESDSSSLSDVILYYAPDATISFNREVSLCEVTTSGASAQWFHYMYSEGEVTEKHTLIETISANTTLNISSLHPTYLPGFQFYDSGKFDIECYIKTPDRAFPYVGFVRLCPLDQYEPDSESKGTPYPISNLAVATTVTANPTSAKVMVDGVETSFDAYNISGNNYFKLRDIAFVLKDKFEIGFSDGKITLTPNAVYTAVGGEMKAGDGTSKDAAPSTDKVYMNGVQLDLTAYKIGGNNYFKLRDVGKALGFDVDWRDSMIWIEKNEAYTED